MRKIVVLTIFAMLLSMVPVANAGGVDVSVTAGTDAEVAANTATTVGLSWQTTAEYATGSTIIITYDDAYQDNSLGNADVSLNSGSATAVVATASNTVTFTLTAPVVSNTTLTVSFDDNFSSPTTAGNYAFFMTAADEDFGGAFQYVEDDNDVTVTAKVATTLEFAIRNAADDADTNSCDLGTLDTSSVSTCQYRLKVTTNASDGYDVSFKVDGDLRKGSDAEAADVDNIDSDDVVSGSAPIGAGTESYGVLLDAGDATVGTVSEADPYQNTNHQPFGYDVAYVAADDFYSSDGPNIPADTADTTNTALVTHAATIDAETAAGNYAQEVKYYVTANF